MVHQRKCCIFFAAGSSHTTTRSETPLRKLKVFYEATTTYAALPQGKREQKTLRLHWILCCGGASLVKMLEFMSLLSILKNIHPLLRNKRDLPRWIFV